MKPRTEVIPTAAGVQEDFQRLLNAFVEMQSVRYEVFAELWRKSNMSSLWAGRENELDMREFTEECMRIAVELWVPSNPFQIQVGGLYLLYALYSKQPIVPKAKIRLTLNHWKETQNFMEEVKSQQHLDVEYIYLCLRYHKAFHFVGIASQKYFTNRNEIEQNKSQIIVSEKSDKSVLSEILEPDDIGQLSAIHEQYHRMKCAISGSSSQPQSSLDVVQDNLVQYITKAVAAHEEWRKNRGESKTRRKRKDSGATTTSESELDSDVEVLKSSPKSQKGDIGSRRAQIKDRAYSGACQISAKSSKYRPHQTDSDDDASPSRRSKGRNRGKRKADSLGSLEAASPSKKGRGRGKGRGKGKTSR